LKFSFGRLGGISGLRKSVGGDEVIFVNGSPDGTVTGPETIPDI
jgi:hypothetical protein